MSFESHKSFVTDQNMNSVYFIIVAQKKNLNLQKKAITSFGLSSEMSILKETLKENTCCWNQHNCCV